MTRLHGSVVIEKEGEVRRQCQQGPLMNPGVLSIIHFAVHHTLTPLCIYKPSAWAAGRWSTETMQTHMVQWPNSLEIQLGGEKW